MVSICIKRLIASTNATLSLCLKALKEIGYDGHLTLEASGYLEKNKRKGCFWCKRPL